MCISKNYRKQNGKNNGLAKHSIGAPGNEKPKSSPTVVEVGNEMKLSTSNARPIETEQKGQAAVKSTPITKGVKASLEKQQKAVSPNQRKETPKEQPKAPKAPQEEPKPSKKVQKAQSNKEKSRQPAPVAVSTTEESAKDNNDNKEEGIEEAKIDIMGTDTDPKSREPTLKDTEEEAIARKLAQIEPPRELKAKRKVEGTKDAKDPEYATLDDECPKFATAALKAESQEKNAAGNPQQQPTAELDMKTAKDKD